jgi:hypothetical protein
VLLGVDSEFRRLAARNLTRSVAQYRKRGVSSSLLRYDFLRGPAQRRQVTNVPYQTQAWVAHNSFSPKPTIMVKIKGEWFSVRLSCLRFEFAQYR